jgi:hypothetical protein
MKRKKGECGMTIAEFQNLLQLEIQALLERHCSADQAAFTMQFHGCRELPVRAMAGRAPKNILIASRCVCILSKYVEIQPIMAGG